MSGSGRRALRILGRGLLATVVPLLLLEAGLQVAALITTWTRASERLASDGEAAIDRRGAPILCVGDSFTFGIGASAPEHAWPRRLEQLLAAEPEHARRVVNSGWPSRDSRELLAALRRELRRVKPGVVLILAGINDRWSRPEPLGPEAPADASSEEELRFRWRWRTPRLLALLLQPRAPPSAQPLSKSSSTGTPEPPSRAARAHPLVAAWERDGQKLAFRPDGTLLVGAARWRWTETDGVLRTVDPDGALQSSRWRVEGDRLHLEPEGQPAIELTRIAASPGEEAASSNRFEELLDAQDDAGADALVEAWLREKPDSADAHLARLRLAVRADARELIDAELDWLRSRRITGDEQAARRFAQALSVAGRREEALATAREDVVRFPEAPRLWHALAVNARLAGDFETAERAVDRAIALSPGASADDRAEERLLRAHVVAERDVDEGARELVRAFELGRDPTLVRRFWLQSRRELTIERLAAAADAIGVDAALRRELLDACPEAEQRGAQTGSRMETVLAGHLVAMVEECRRAGATPWLLTYPTRMADVDAARDEAVRRTGVAVIDVAARFEQLLRELPRAALFIADGHCNDRGYDEMASVVRTAVASRLDDHR